MKIFLAFLQAKKKHVLPSYNFWEYYIKKGIEEAGHTWVECDDVDWASGLLVQDSITFENWKSSAWEKTHNFLREQPADIFLSYLFPKQVDQNTVKLIQKAGIPCVNFFCDNVREFTTIPPEFAPFDLNWVPEYGAISMYQKAGYKGINLPMPMWVDPQNRTIANNETKQISFAGSYDIQRHLLFEDVLLKSPDLPLSIYGEGWIKDGAPPSSLSPGKSSGKLANQIKFINQFGISAYVRKLQQRNVSYIFSEDLKKHVQAKPLFDEYNSITRESMITLGVNRYPDYRYPVRSPHTYSRLRDIEAPMLGACYLTEWTDGLDQLYDIGTEISVYKNAGELIEQCDLISKSPELRKKLRMNGQKRALSEHSICRSLEKIKTTLFS